jgi:hypothetical protein
MEATSFHCFSSMNLRWCFHSPRTSVSFGVCGVWGEGDAMFAVRTRLWFSCWTTPDSVANSIPSQSARLNCRRALHMHIQNMYWTSGPTGELCSLFLNAYILAVKMQSEYDKRGPIYLLVYRLQNYKCNFQGMVDSSTTPCKYVTGTSMVPIQHSKLALTWYGTHSCVYATFIVSEFP